MEGNEFIVAIVAIVFGTAFTGFVLYLIFSTIKSWINRKGGSVDEEYFDRMAQAFIEHKKNTERRLQNLEAIVTGDESETQPAELEEPEQTIEIERKEPTEAKQKESDGRLRNILKE